MLTVFHDVRYTRYISFKGAIPKALSEFNLCFSEPWYAPPHINVANVAKCNELLPLKSLLKSVVILINSIMFPGVRYICYITLV